MPVRFALVALTAAMGASASSAHRSPAVQPNDTTICEIVEHSLQFNGKLVRVHADAYGVEIDNPEELLDRSCQEYSLRIEFPNGHGGYQVRKLQQALAPHLKGKIRVHGAFASGTFIGTVYYSWAPSWGVDIHLTVKAVPELVIPPLPATKPK